MKETTIIGLPKEAVKFVESNLLNTNSYKVYEVINDFGYLGERLELHEYYLTNQRIVRERVEKRVFNQGYDVYLCLVGEEGETLYSWEDGNEPSWE
jgi:hypothetical protein